MSAPPFGIDLITLFPEFFSAPLTVGLVGRALREGRADVRFIDPRRLTYDRHRSVDDAPYGGGAGMVMKVEPLDRAIDLARRRGEGPVVLLSPQGRPLFQRDFERWSTGEHLSLVCGRYEGFDERIRGLVDDEVSVGDFVLTGGEPAALLIVDGVVRLRPGTLGNEASAPGDSFSDGLLEHAQYTRPERFNDAAVPAVLLGGNHRDVETWRRRDKLFRTRARRPDLLREMDLGVEDRRVLAEQPPRRRVSLAIGFDEEGPSLEAVVALARLGAAFQLERVLIVGPRAEKAVESAPDQAQLGLPGPKRRDPPERLVLRPSERVEAAPDWEAGCRLLGPDLVVVSAARGTEEGRAALSLRAVRATADSDRVCLAFGVGARAAPPLGPGLRGLLPGLRQGSGWNALDPVAAAAIYLERVLGEG